MPVEHTSSVNDSTAVPFCYFDVKPLIIAKLHRELWSNMALSNRVNLILVGKLVKSILITTKL